MIPIDGSVPVSGVQPTEPTKGTMSIEPPRKLSIDESPPTQTADASKILGSLTKLSTTEIGRQLLGEAIRQGTQPQEE